MALFDLLHMCCSASFDFGSMLQSWYTLQSLDLCSICALQVDVGWLILLYWLQVELWDVALVQVRAWDLCGIHVMV